MLLSFLSGKGTCILGAKIQASNSSSLKVHAKFLDLSNFADFLRKKKCFAYYRIQITLSQLVIDSPEDGSLGRQTSFYAVNSSTSPSVTDMPGPEAGVLQYNCKTC